MERVNEVALKVVLTETDGQSQTRLPNAELMDLGSLMEQMARRWPAQDMQDSIGEYMTDFEQLAIREGLQTVKEAVDALRISPKQKFYPRPDEVAEEIDRQRPERQAAADAEREARARQRRIKEFWEWAPQWMQDTGNDEEELLKRHPCFRGTKPECVEGEASR